MAKHTQIQEMLDGLHSLSAVQREQILQRTATMKDAELDQVIVVLMKVKEGEDRMIGNAIASDPAFLPKLQRFMRETAEELTKEGEHGSDEDLNALFEDAL